MTVVDFAVFVAGLLLGHWAGYWYGRCREMYESGKRYGVIPADMTWAEFLNSSKERRDRS